MNLHNDELGVIFIMIFTDSKHIIANCQNQKDVIMNQISNKYENIK